MTELLAVFTTVASRDDALRLAQAAIARRLAACVQMSAIESTYRWDSALRHEAEIRLVFKTTAERWPALEQTLLELHPYELPALFATAVTHASQAYTAWVVDETTPRP